MSAPEIIEHANRLREFQSEWNQLLRRLPPGTPFQTPEWLISWWSHFGSGSLRVLAFRKHGELMGVVPCFLHEWNQQRQITLLGSGVSDYLDPLIDPNHSPEIVEELRAELNRWTDWDLCDWQDLSENTPLRELGIAQAETPCSSVVLGGSFEEFLASRPKDLRRNLRRYKEKAEALGSVSFEVTDRATPELMDALIALHGARWNKAGQSGMIEANRSEGFLRETANSLGPADLLRIFSVRFEDRVVAILLALRTPTTIFSYLSAFDPEQEKFGFGRELLAQAFRYAHEGGYRCWNFLRGDEPYKASWGAQPIEKCRLTIRPYRSR